MGVESEKFLNMNVVCCRELYYMMNRIANTLKSHGVEQGDVVVLYMPVSPHAVAAMLACARIGAPHSVVFAGFSAEALASRIQDGMRHHFYCSCYLIIMQPLLAPKIGGTDIFEVLFVISPKYHSRF